ncbi:hypothetical protein LBMAG42_13830 [Deltaproteobacteria bacterium]|nr:hypothetical protein LBMAG42_13830 [Deltaproteobacteria bacterium]
MHAEHHRSAPTHLRDPTHHRGRSIEAEPQTAVGHGNGEAKNSGFAQGGDRLYGEVRVGIEARGTRLDHPGDDAFKGGKDIRQISHEGLQAAAWAAETRLSPYGRIVARKLRTEG